jgi:hypothetical protein
MDASQVAGRDDMGERMNIATNFRKPETETPPMRSKDLRLTASERDVWERILAEGWKQMQDLFPRLHLYPEPPKPKRRSLGFE